MGIELKWHSRRFLHSGQTKGIDSSQITVVLNWFSWNLASYSQWLCIHKHEREVILLPVLQSYYSLEWWPCKSSKKIAWQTSVFSSESAWFQIKQKKRYFGNWRVDEEVVQLLLFVVFFIFNLQKVYSILNNNRCPRSECRVIIHSQGSAAVHKLLRRCLTSAESCKWITAPYPHWGHTLLDATGSQDTVGSCHQLVCRLTRSEGKYLLIRSIFPKHLLLGHVLKQRLVLQHWLHWWEFAARVEGTLRTMWNLQENMMSEFHSFLPVQHHENRKRH